MRVTSSFAVFLLDLENLRHTNVQEASAVHFRVKNRRVYASHVSPRIALRLLRHCSSCGESLRKHLHENALITADAHEVQRNLRIGARRLFIRTPLAKLQNAVAISKIEGRRVGLDDIRA